MKILERLCEYWNDKKLADKCGLEVKDICVHESDGHFYMNGKIHNTVPSGLSLNELFDKGLRKKCLKCGGFYG